MHERLADLLVEVGNDVANKTLRKGYSTNDASALIRFTGEANGLESFINFITADPKVSRRG